MSETVRAATHIHTRRSWDGIIRPHALVDRLEDAGIGLALVTDHDSFDGARAVAEVVAERDLEIRIPVAAEIRTDLGDLVVVFDEVEPPRIEDLKHWQDLVATVRDLGGIVWFPHPFRGHSKPDVLAEHSDVIEVFNSRCSREQNNLARRMCEQVGAIPAFGSDAHLLSEVDGVVVEYRLGSTVTETLKNPPTPIATRRVRRTDKDLAEIVNGVKRKRLDLVGYFSARYVEHLLRGGLEVPPMEVDRSIPAYVVGEGNTDLTRALGLAGIKSVAMASGSSTARFSRFVTRTLPVVDPWTQPERLVETLVRAGAEEERRPVLVYQGDGHALAVSRFRERLEPYFRFSIPPMQLTEELNDKLQFQKLAERLDLPVPAAVIINPMREEMPSELPFGFPFVVKPISRSVHHWAADGAKASLVSSWADLVALWSELSHHDAQFVVQEMVDGPESNVVSYHAYIANDGTVVGEFTGEKIRTKPAVFGHSSSVRVLTLPDVALIGRDLVERLEFSGVVKFDFKVRPDGQFALFEVNTKFNLWHLPRGRGRSQHPRVGV